jgi:nicotinamide riboside kinase
MNEILSNSQVALVVGKSASGKSHMIELFAEMSNLLVRQEYERGKNSEKLLRLEKIDASLEGVEDDYIQ